MTAHKVIFDTDPGLDDAIAFVLAARHPDVELIGITSVFGNADIDATTRNACCLAKRFTSGVPVARGAGAPIEGGAPVIFAAVHGKNVFGSAAVGDEGAMTLDASAASRFIIDRARERPGEITIVALGPLTNLALALGEDPAVASLVKRVIVMGGAFGMGGVQGNYTPAAEANMFADPHAADLVFAAEWPVTIVGLDVTHQIVMTQAYLDSLHDHGGEAGRFVREISRNREPYDPATDGLEGIVMHDAAAVAYLLAPGLFQTRSGPVRVVAEGLAAGHTIQKPNGMRCGERAWDARPSCSVCIGVDARGVLALYKETLCRRG
jgi:purine nucleosidase